VTSLSRANTIRGRAISPPKAGRARGLTPSAGKTTKEFVMGKGNKVRKKEVKKPKQDKKKIKK
jgi:hypothetical protein